MAGASDSSAAIGQDWLTRHHQVLTQARAALRSRTYVSPYPEKPSGKIYGETAAEEGQAAFEALRNKPFDLDQPAGTGQVGAEASPYGLALGITYPQADLDGLLRVVQAAMPAWRDTGFEVRAAIALEILHRLNRQSFLMANAIMHTTGQSFMMAFQAGGPHAQDRGLEALACACDEMSRFPGTVSWEKQVGKDAVERFRKVQRIVPRGVAAVVACSTFPTWNTYPAFFANLVTGNAVVVKPHPGAILPLALTVRTARSVIAESGFDPNIVTLAADAPQAPITEELVTRPEVRLVDYTGSSAFGKWIEQHATNAMVFTEKAGVNSVILDSVRDLGAVAANLALSTCLYSGQMCTSPQNIFIPRDGVVADGGAIGFDDVLQTIVGAMDRLLGEPRRACDVLGAIQSPATLERIQQAAAEGPEVIRPSGKHHHSQFPEACIRSPVVLSASSDNAPRFMREMFGPIVYVIATRDTAESINLAARCARDIGSITGSVYSMDANVQKIATDAMTLSGVPVCVNLTGQKLVNQAAAFSDLHVSGLNPSGNATFCDGAFVSSRFRVVQSCWPA